MIKHRLLLIAFIFFLFILSLCESAEAYKAGDIIHVTYNPHLNIGTKPKFVRYTLFDPSNKVVYEEDHEITHIKIIPPGIFWEWSDEYDIRVQGFSELGTWRVEGRLFSEALWIIEVPDLFPLKQTFMVEETGLLENLFAPWYFTYDGGLFVGRVSSSLPVHIYLILLIVGVFVVSIIMVKLFINIAVMNDGGKKA